MATGAAALMSMVLRSVLSSGSSRKITIVISGRTIRRSAVSYTHLAVDSRGHGASESGTQGLSFALMAEDLKKVLDARGVKKAHILGFSDGGNLAIKFALTYPDYVDKLILNGANVEMFNGIKPHFQLPIYAAYGLDVYKRQQVVRAHA